MWMKTRFAQWEVEGQVRERVNRALAECERERQAGASQDDLAGRRPRLSLATIGAALAWLSGRAAAALVALRGSLGAAPEDRPVQRSSARTATETAPDGSRAILPR
jgi:hypothetical protein